MEKNGKYRRNALVLSLSHKEVTKRQVIDYMCSAGNQSMYCPNPGGVCTTLPVICGHVENIKNICDGINNAVNNG